MEKAIRKTLSEVPSLTYHDYHAKAYYEQDPWIKEALDFIIGKEMRRIGEEASLKRLYQELLNKDWFMTLLDVKAYHECRNQAFADYESRSVWAKKMLVNIANCAYFSADRAIREYAKTIWHL